MTRQELKQAARAYFDAIDRYDMEAVVSLFTEDCVATMEPPHNVWTGHPGLREWLSDLFGRSSGMRHADLNVSVDEGKRRVVAEQDVMVAWSDEPRVTLHNITAVDFAPDGRIAAVSFWLGHDRESAHPEHAGR